jgi:hypothetical protein
MKPPIKKIAGRQRLVWPIFDNQSQAAEWLGCPVSLIQSAKRNGCGAFISGNRIDSNKLAPFIVDTLLNDNSSIYLDERQEKAKLNAAQRRKLEREEAIETKTLHDENSVDQKIRHELLMPLRDGLQGLQKNIIGSKPFSRTSRKKFWKTICRN